MIVQLLKKMRGRGKTVKNRQEQLKVEVKEEAG